MNRLIIIAILVGSLCANAFAEDLIDNRPYELTPASEAPATTATVGARRLEPRHEQRWTSGSLGARHWAPPTSGTQRAWRGRPGFKPGPGPGFGPGGGRMMVDSIDRWRSIDARIQEATRRFRDNNSRRERLMASLTEHKDQAKPGQMDPMAILARKEVDRTLGELHSVVEADHANNEDIARLMRGLAMSQDRWMDPLSKLLGRAVDDRNMSDTERARIRRWRQGLPSLQQDDVRGFMNQVLGTEYTDYLVASMPMIAHRPSPGDGPPMGGGKGGTEGGEGRRGIVGRIAQLERQQAFLRQELDRQDREISTLRKMLQNPGPGKEKPPAKPKPEASNKETE